MKHSRTLFVVAFAVLFLSRSLASAQNRPGWGQRPPKLELLFVDEDAAAPIGGNEALGDFKVELIATAYDGDVCISRTLTRGPHFAILDGMGRPVSFSVGVFAAAVSPPEKDGNEVLLPGDTSERLCVRAFTSRTLFAKVRLGYPAQASFLAVRLKDVDAGRAKVRRLPDRASFTAGPVYLSERDLEN